MSAFFHRPCRRFRSGLRQSCCVRPADQAVIKDAHPFESLFFQQNLNPSADASASVFQVVVGDYGSRFAPFSALHKAVPINGWASRVSPPSISFTLRNIIQLLICIHITFIRRDMWFDLPFSGRHKIHANYLPSYGTHGWKLNPLEFLAANG